jgi:MOSC domain-containing protein YiiM
VKRFLASKRTGFYLAVLREGEVGEGDQIDFIAKQETGVTITEIVNLYSTDTHNQELLTWLSSGTSVYQDRSRVRQNLLRG